MLALEGDGVMAAGREELPGRVAGRTVTGAGGLAGRWTGPTDVRPDGPMSVDLRQAAVGRGSRAVHEARNVELARRARQEGRNGDHARRAWAERRNGDRARRASHGGRNGERARRASGLGAIARGRCAQVVD